MFHFPVWTPLISTIMPRSLIRPSIAYTGWDADSIQGCVCDLGYAGYDCSERRCPEGRDPLASGTVRYEAFTLVCGGQSGSFNIEVLGMYARLMYKLNLMHFY